MTSQKNDQPRPIVFITRTETFSASHRLNNKLLGIEENKQIYGKCNNLNGHGHNYKVTVTIKGEVDEKTGMVMNLADLKDIINEHVIDLFDHRNIDEDLPYFKKGVVSTAENISVYIYNILKSHLPPASLYEVKVQESEKNVAYFRGEFVNCV